MQCFNCNSMDRFLVVGFSEDGDRGISLSMFFMQRACVRESVYVHVRVGTMHARGCDYVHLSNSCLYIVMLWTSVYKVTKVT